MASCAPSRRARRLQPSRRRSRRRRFCLLLEMSVREVNCRHICARLPLTIQGVPKRSTSMPNTSAQNVLSKGIVT